MAGRLGSSGGAGRSGWAVGGPERAGPGSGSRGRKTPGDRGPSQDSVPELSRREAGLVLSVTDYPCLVCSGVLPTEAHGNSVSRQTLTLSFNTHSSIINIRGKRFSPLQGARMHTFLLRIGVRRSRGGSDPCSAGAGGGPAGGSLHLRVQHLLGGRGACPARRTSHTQTSRESAGPCGTWRLALGTLGDFCGYGAHSVPAALPRAESCWFGIETRDSWSTAPTPHPCASGGGTALPPGKPLQRPR